MDIQACFRCSMFARMLKSLPIGIFKRVSMFNVCPNPQSLHMWIFSRVYTAPMFAHMNYTALIDFRENIFICIVSCPYSRGYFLEPQNFKLPLVLFGHFFFYMGTFDLVIGYFCPLPRVSAGFEQDC